MYPRAGQGQRLTHTQIQVHARDAPPTLPAGAGNFARLVSEPDALVQEAKQIERQIEEMCLENYHVHIENGVCVAEAHNEVHGHVVMMQGCH